MHIVVLDDEKILTWSIKDKLEKQWYEVTALTSYTDFLWFDINQNVDLFLVDLSLWDWSGMDVVETLKQNKHTLFTPIIFISGHNDLNLKVSWLDAWADDYIVKPFQFEELFARIRSNIRKQHPDTPSSKITFWDIKFDSATRKVHVWNQEIRLWKKEKQILEYFMLHPGVCISKNTLQKMFWKWVTEYSIPENTINVTICNLRKKLRDKINLETIVWEWYCLHD